MIWTIKQLSCSVAKSVVFHFSTLAAGCFLVCGHPCVSLSGFYFGRIPQGISERFSFADNRFMDEIDGAHCIFKYFFVLNKRPKLKGSEVAFNVN